ncbi:MAG TPA: class I SAM-dependent methyltransferase [Acidobacteriota bacterium]|nr:class I SAM-dependent methyltransferase [Acidobacteriota bacterium]
MKTNRMYDEFAHLWPLISAPEDYAHEASFWRNAIREKLGQGRHEILELGVGGGNNLSHLTSDFSAVAVDISEKMLANSIKLNPGVEHHVGDMRTVRLGRLFDAVLIHDAINYMLTEDDLRAVLGTAWMHLRPGGILVMSPDNFKETFADGFMRHGTHSDGTTELTYVQYEYDPDPDDTTTETLFIFFIREGGKVRVEQDLHVTGLFPRQRWLDLMEAAGFAAEEYDYPVHEHTDQGSLLVGLKP